MTRTKSLATSLSFLFLSLYFVPAVAGQTEQAKTADEYFLLGFKLQVSGRHRRAWFQI